MKLAQSNGQTNDRRIKVLNTLTSQLASGLKPEKKVPLLTRATTGGNDEPLTEGDIKRIKNEISILKTRIVSRDVARATRKK